MPGLRGWEVNMPEVDSDLSTPLPAAHLVECWSSVPGCQWPGWESLCYLWTGRNEWGSGQSLSHRGMHWCYSRGEHTRSAESSYLLTSLLLHPRATHTHNTLVSGPFLVPSTKPSRVGSQGSIPLLPSKCSLLSMVNACWCYPMKLTFCGLSFHYCTENVEYSWEITNGYE